MKPYFNMEDRRLIYSGTLIGDGMMFNLRVEQLVREVKRVKNKYYWSQWKDPKRFLYKSWGITFWKWCGIWVPMTTICLGGRYSIEWGILCDGIGFGIYLPGFVFQFRPTGGVRYHGMKYFRLKIFNKNLILF